MSDSITSDSESFSRACETVMTFGKYQGKTVGRIGAGKEGLLYLDWLVDQPPLTDRMRDTQEVLRTYLAHPEISRQLDTYLED